MYDGVGISLCCVAARGTTHAGNSPGKPRQVRIKSHLQLRTSLRYGDDDLSWLRRSWAEINYHCSQVKLLGYAARHSRARGADLYNQLVCLWLLVLID